MSQTRYTDRTFAKPGTGDQVGYENIISYNYEVAAERCEYDENRRKRGARGGN